jgi:hypothetical protein
LFGLPRTCCGGYPLQSFLFVPHKKGFPLLSCSPSAENRYSAFIVEKIAAEIDGGLKTKKNICKKYPNKKPRSG